MRGSRGADKGGVIVKEDLDLRVCVVADEKDARFEAGLRESTASGIDGVGEFGGDCPLKRSVCRGLNEM